jgi:hypothetical protein
MIANRTKPAIEEDKGVLRQIVAKWLNLPLHFRLSLGIATSIMSFFILEGSVNLAIAWNSAENEVIQVSNQAAVYYNDVRLICQITHRLNELQEQEQIASHQGESLRAEAASRPTAQKEHTEADIHYICKVNYKADRRLPSGGRSLSFLLRVLTNRLS